MGTITSPRREDSTTGYTAQIRIMRDCAQVYQVSQAFDRKQAAQAWIKRRESELAESAAPRRGSLISLVQAHALGAGLIARPQVMLEQTLIALAEELTWRAAGRR